MNLRILDEAQIAKILRIKASTPELSASQIAERIGCSARVARHVLAGTYLKGKHDQEA